MKSLMVRGAKGFAVCGSLGLLGTILHGSITRGASSSTGGVVEETKRKYFYLSQDSELLSKVEDLMEFRLFDKDLFERITANVDKFMCTIMHSKRPGASKSFMITLPRTASRLCTRVKIALMTLKRKMMQAGGSKHVPAFEEQSKSLTEYLKNLAGNLQSDVRYAMRYGSA